MAPNARSPDLNPEAKKDYTMTNSKYESIDGGIAPDTEMITTAEDGSITATLYDPNELTAAVSKYYEKYE